MTQFRRFLRIFLVLLAGLLAPLHAQVLVSTNSSWSYRKGSAEASSPVDAWRARTFDDTTWAQSDAPFYYDTGGSYTGSTLLGDMRNSYVSVFLRRKFTLSSPTDLGTLELRYLCDDGFVLWINGVLVTSYNKSPANVAFDSLAASSVGEPLAWLGQTLTNPQRYLVAGENVVAVQAFNASRSSTDFVFELELVGTRRDDVPPVIASVTPGLGTIGALTAITVTFSEPVSGLGFSDLLINDRPAQALSGSGAIYTFTLEQPAYGDVQVRWDEGVAIRDFSVPANTFDPTGPGATWSYTLVDQTPPVVAEIAPPPDNTVRTLTQLEVTFSEPVSGVDAADLQINGQSAASVTGSGAGPYVFQFAGVAAGAVQVAWRGDHGVQDEASPPNAFAGGAWSYTVDPDFTFQPVRISEFLAGYSGNDGGLADEDDELQDWIELHNRGAGAVNLRGWSLTDDADEPGKWVFPDAVIPAGGYLVVFASGKDRKPAGVGARLHTNFKLGLDGEYLGLFNAESPRLKVAEFAPEYPEQRNDHSYGFDAQDRLRHFAQPTPGAANGVSSIAGVVPPVGFSVGRGLYDQPFELRLTNAVPGASIRYTTDGSEPGPASGQLYQGPLTIESTTILRAAAFAPDRLPANSVTHTYIFPAQVLTQPANPPGLPAEWIDTQGRSWTADYGMDPEIVNHAAYRAQMLDSLRALPVLSIVTRPQDMFSNANGIYPKSQARGPAWERPASAEFIYADPDDSVQVNCGVQMQGNSVRDPVKTGKHAFRLLFKRDYGPPKLRHRVFPESPVDEFDTLTVRADFNNSWMHWNGEQRPRGQRVRDAWMKSSQRAMGGLASHSRFYHLYVNGLYWGVYDPVERPDANFAAAYLGGEPEDYDVVNEGQLVDGSMTAYNAMRGISGLQDHAQYERMKQHLDVPAYIDYVLLHFYTGHQDWFTDKNWYAIRRRAPGEGFRYQAWDGELMLNSPTDNIVTRTDQPSDLHPKLIASAQYRLDFADRVHRHLFNGGALTPAAAAARYDEWAGQVELAMLAESARWGDYRRDVHQYSSGPYLLYTPEHFATERARLLDGYFPVRTGNLLNQLRAAGLYPATAAPSFSRHGGRVAPGFRLTITAPAGTIHYTTDGSDPRTVYTGAVAGTAQTYSAPVTLEGTTLVRARVRNGTEWSALNEALFEVGSLGVQLVLTEIQYNPVGGDPYEFIELRNAGPTTVTADGFSFDGLGYVFPPGSVIAAGQTLVLASALSPSAFAARYPGVTVSGYFDGALANGGERIALLDREGRTIVSVDYDDDAGWSVAADGNGPSLELLDPRGDPDAAANWRASLSDGGTPGASVTPPETPLIRLNELMAVNGGSVRNGATAPDWVELHNAGSTAADLSGWSLSDSSMVPPFVFATGTSLAPGSFLVVWCDDDASAPGMHTGFALDRSGETLSLFNAGGQRVDAVTFGVQLPDLTLGRAGESHDWQLCLPTPGESNTLQPLANVTNLVINEWLADSPPGEDDWLELYNRHESLPAALAGVYLETEDALFRLRALSFIGPTGHLQLRADERPGADHVDFKLSAAGGSLTLFDAAAVQVDRVAYGQQAEGVSLGRLPDGAAKLVAFPDSPTPGAPNRLGDPDPTPPTLSLVTLAGDTLSFRVSGGTTPTYRLEASANLTVWETLATTNTLTQSFTWSVNLGAEAWRFLRVVPGP